MELALIVAGLLVLLAINAFFVVAEFALVKVRPSRVDELVQGGDPRAVLLQQIIQRLDEYLAVCQVGITVASVALGFVGQQASAWFLGGGQTSLLHGLAAAMVSLVVVSGSHIVLGEQVPKYLAIRIADRIGLLSARPLRWCHRVFYIPLWVLNRLSLLVLRLFGVKGAIRESEHSEDELRIILNRSQGAGLMSFRRLLYIENVFDLGELKAADVMRTRDRTRCLDLARPWADNRSVWSQSRFSRYPLLSPETDAPIGILHVKDLLLQPVAGEPDLRALARPYLSVPPERPLEAVLAEMQRRRIHVALVFQDGRWTGFLSMEDILEEIIGTVHDEFEVEQVVTLAESINPARVVLDVEAPTLSAAIGAVVARLPATELPQPAEAIIRAVLEREKLAATYLGKGVAMPHARLPGLKAPLVIFACAPHGIPVDAGPGRHERAHLLFMLLSPAGMPRVHQRLQARIVAVLENSDFVVERLRAAASAEEVVEVLRTGEQAALD
jgi:CBS domain containing-hemolysin-like protein